MNGKYALTAAQKLELKKPKKKAKIDVSGDKENIKPKPKPKRKSDAVDEEETKAKTKKAPKGLYVFIYRIELHGLDISKGVGRLARKLVICYFLR